MPGCHDIPIANSDARCLIKNWFEERSTSCLDAERKNDVILRITKAHRGLLVPPCDYKIEDFTTHLDAYRPLRDACRNNKTRHQAMEKLFYEQAVKELEDKKNQEREIVSESVAAPPPRERCVCPLAETFRPDYVYEQPLTFWSQNCRKVQGVSQIKKTFDTPFRKNAAFSTPTELSWEPHSNKPYDHELVPNM